MLYKLKNKKIPPDCFIDVNNYKICIKKYILNNKKINILLK